MKFGAEEIQQHAAALGFRPDSLEKVFRLLSLLEALRSHAFLRPRVALKGGTALNLFLFDVPRLSVDIDLSERLTVKRMPSEHAGGKWQLSFMNTAGSSDKLEVDLNFMLRVPLWPVTTLDSKAIGPAVAMAIAVVDRHELAAGKLAALCSRNASRDIFDARELLRRTDLEESKLRLAFVVYGGQNRKDWRTVRVEDVAAEAAELKRELVPMLRAEVRPKESEIASWTESLVHETRELLAVVLPLAEHELEFLERLNGAGDVVSEILTNDPAMQVIIREQPGLKWKALNVKKRPRVVVDDQEPPA